MIIDPNFTIKPSESFDYILVTHEHNDHIDLEKLKEIDYKTLLAPKYTIEFYRIDGKAVRAGTKIEDIEVLESWCRNAVESVSYFYKGILHAGDSAKFPEVKGVKVVFTACFPDFYENYIAEMKKIRPDMAIPIHYDPEKKIENAGGLKEKLQEEGINCKILKVEEVLRS